MTRQLMVERKQLMWDADYSFVISWYSLASLPTLHRFHCFVSWVEAVWPRDAHCTPSVILFKHTPVINCLLITPHAFILIVISPTRAGLTPVAECRLAFLCPSNHCIPDHDLFLCPLLRHSRSLPPPPAFIDSKTCIFLFLCAVT